LLTDVESGRIAENGYLYDHAWRFTSLLAGEPFWVDGSLLHFDGRHLYILDFPIGEGSAGIAPLLGEWVARFNPSLIWYSGRSALPAAPLGSLKPIHLYEPDPADVCMEIDLSTFRLEANPKLMGWVRAGEKKGYTIDESMPGFLGHQHIQIIENFARRASPGPIARSFLGCLGHFVRLDEARLVNVWQGEQLVAFGVVEGWFKKMDVRHASVGIDPQRSTARQALLECRLLHQCWNQEFQGKMGRSAGGEWLLRPALAFL
jgi:hypothetical protein